MIGANKYTTPKLHKGTKPVVIPKGSTLEKEIAKNDWYINYSFNRKQYRIKGDLNREKDPKEKQRKAEVLLQSIIDDLLNGYDPENPTAFIEQLAKETISLKDAVDKYLLDLTHARPKTIGSYQSKLVHLIEAYPNKQLRDLTPKDIEKYIHNKIHKGEQAQMFVNGKLIETDMITKWTPATVKAAKGVFRAFFNWCISEGYTNDNPATKIEAKKIRSEHAAKERNIPFTTTDMKTIMNYLHNNDKFTAFFCRIIYSSLLRPKEISELKIKDIDLTNKQIIIPLSTTKNTKRNKVDRIDIEENLWSEIEDLNLTDYLSNYYLTSNDTVNIIGAKTIGNNKPYKRFISTLKKLNLNDKGYTLYSFKHYSNIQRLNNGWTLAEIMKANRHSSIAMTEKYLKDITRQTDISKKEVPAI